MGYSPQWDLDGVHLPSPGLDWVTLLPVWTGWGTPWPGLNGVSSGQGTLGQFMLWLVRLLRFPIGGLSCIIVIYLIQFY